MQRVDLLARTGAPVITTPPADTIVALGGSFVLFVPWSGSGPAGQLWTQAGVRLTHENNHALIRSVSKASDAGVDAVDITNASDDHRPAQVPDGRRRHGHGLQRRRHRDLPAHLPVVLGRLSARRRDERDAHVDERIGGRSRGLHGADRERRGDRDLQPGRARGRGRVPAGLHRFAGGPLGLSRADRDIERANPGPDLFGDVLLVVGLLSTDSRTKAIRHQNAHGDGEKTGPHGRQNAAGIISAVPRSHRGRAWCSIVGSSRAVRSGRGR